MRISMDVRDSVLSYHTKVEVLKYMSFVISINHPIRLQTISIFSLDSFQILYLSYQIDITLLIYVVILILIYYKCIQIIITMTFLETAVPIGFLPHTTLPTRIGEAGYRSSLIDNIFTNSIDAIEHTISGTLLTYITDHKQSYFC